ncbi:MAG: acetylxylan esterase [Gemmatimonadota bacterium]|nr:acetylxylan esterase [Gemmatimonadota bacterium]
MSTQCVLSGTSRLDVEGDLAAAMVAGIDRYLTRATRSARRRRDSKRAAASDESQRQRLSDTLGLFDSRESGTIRIVSPIDGPAEVASGQGCRIFEVNWPALKGVDGEGLLLQPDRPPVANVIALPDCDFTPEQFSGLQPGVPASSHVARRLADNGCRVLVPLLMDRRCDHSGHPDIGMTNQPHREFIYRAAYELGRHVIGYEIQKILAAVDALCSDDLPVGVFGHGEGGLVAFYAAALDARIGAVSVSGYFQPREDLWRQPIYRNLFGLLDAFGDAEIASLIAPRSLVVEIADHPEITGPPEARGRRQTAAPGRLTTPRQEAVEAEFDRARGLAAADGGSLVLTRSPDGRAGADVTLEAFLKALGASSSSVSSSSVLPTRVREGVSQKARFKRQFDQLLDHTQFALSEAEFRRAGYWTEAGGSDTGIDAELVEEYRRRLWDDVIGPLPPISLSPNPRTRLFYDHPEVRAYEVVLEVYSDVFAYGILLIPKSIRKDEKHPIVVCQHGLEGRAQSVVDPNGPRHPYRNFAYDLAREGFVTYAPQNPYIGQDAFRVLQRKANPLKLSLFSFIVRQHEQTLAWLSSLPYVDAGRIGFYGISYGGKTAMRVPALVKQYCLSICSADFNEWIWKNASARHRYSYLFSGEYEMPEFNLGNTFNYAEMSWLICPRPFMVERGHHDGVAPDEWVAYEYARTYRHYALRGLEDRTEIEYFNGPHTINGVSTFEFLRKHLKKRDARGKT